MMISGCAAACSAYSTLAAYEETNQVTLAVQEQTNQTEPMISWEENSARLRRLARSTQETQTDSTD